MKFLKIQKQIRQPGDAQDFLRHVIREIDKGFQVGEGWEIESDSAENEPENEETTQDEEMDEESGNGSPEGTQEATEDPLDSES